MTTIATVTVQCDRCGFKDVDNAPPVGIAAGLPEGWRRTGISAPGFLELADDMDICPACAEAYELFKSNVMVKPTKES